jgi:hypothetical protein
LQEICWPALRTGGAIDTQSIQDYQAWAVESGLMETPVEPEQYWDSSFIDNAQ